MTTGRSRSSTRISRLVALPPEDNVFEKMIVNIQEAKGSRRAVIVYDARQCRAAF